MKVKLFAALGSLFIVSSLAPAFAGLPPVGTPEGGGTIPHVPTNSLSVQLRCEHSPKEVGGSIGIKNSTQTSIPAGTSISWNIPKDGEKGVIKLTQALQPGNTIYQTVSANYNNGHLPCNASYLK